MKYVRISLVVALLVSALVIDTKQSRAALIIADPDDFSTGTILTSAFPGVTLSVEGHPDQVVRSRVGVVQAGPTAGQNISSTGVRVFGHDLLAGSPPEDFRILWTTGSPILSPILRADFLTPTDFVSIDMIANDDDSFALRAFSANGQLLQTFNTGSFRNDVRTASIIRPSADIAFVLASGLAPEGVGLLDNLRYNLAVPEPGTFMLFSVGLAGLGFFGWRGKSGKETPGRLSLRPGWRLFASSSVRLKL